jgi:hypothetical protein
METPSSYPEPQPASCRSYPTLVERVDQVCKFDKEFLKRRMREFRERQEQQERELLLFIQFEKPASERKPR